MTPKWCYKQTPISRDLSPWPDTTKIWCYFLPSWSQREYKFPRARAIMIAIEENTHTNYASNAVINRIGIPLFFIVHIAYPSFPCISHPECFERPYLSTSDWSRKRNNFPYLYPSPPKQKDITSPMTNNHKIRKNTPWQRKLLNYCSGISEARGNLLYQSTTQYSYQFMYVSSKEMRSGLFEMIVLVPGLCNSTWNYGSGRIIQRLEYLGSYRRRSYIQAKVW